MYQFAQAVDIDGANVACVKVPNLPEFKIILAQFLWAHPDISTDLVFEGRDSLAIAGIVSRALNRRLRWPVVYLPPQSREYFYQWPVAARGPSPEQIYIFYWGIMEWFTDSRTMKMMLIIFGVAGVSVLFGWIMSFLLYSLDINLPGR